VRIDHTEEYNDISVKENALLAVETLENLTIADSEWHDLELDGGDSMVAVSDAILIEKRDGVENVVAAALESSKVILGEVVNEGFATSANGAVIMAVKKARAVGGF